MKSVTFAVNKPQNIFTKTNIIQQQSVNDLENFTLFEIYIETSQFFNSSSFSW